jgi:hypothetical protein
LDPRDKSRGESWTPSISEWPNDAVVCSLWQVLEAAEFIPPRFFLSSRACAGILSRAGRRGKKLPPLLDAALREAARLGPNDPVPNTSPTKGEETEETEETE